MPLMRHTDHDQFQEVGPVIMKIFYLLIVSLLCANKAWAHGSIEAPVSRGYNCFLEGPENPISDACKAAVAVSGPQGLYDWNGVNQLPNGQHQTVVPDGQLCSAGNAIHSGLDLPRTDWPATHIVPDSNGNFDFIYRATAPHSTAYMKFYVTVDGYDPTQPLRWSDLESTPFCTVNDVTLNNGRYWMTCPLPVNKIGKHVIYNIWQRDDSPEAFYACVDVTFSDEGPTDPDPDPPVTDLQWEAIGPVLAHQTLPYDSAVTLRVFNDAGQDIESHSIDVTSETRGADQWPAHLATVVNTTSTRVRLGVKASDGSVSPIQSAEDNLLHRRSDMSLSFQVDIEMPEETPLTDSGPINILLPTYPSGAGNYGPGSQVQGTDGGVYECRPFPYSGWCNLAPLYYAPGTGLAWTDAWTQI